MNNGEAIPVSSPLYLHPNESTNLFLVQPVFDGSDYHTWSRSVRMALIAKNKVCFIDGTLPRPADDDRTLPAWNQCNTLVTSWILNSVHAKIARNLLFVNTSYEVWEDIKFRFATHDSYRLSNLLEDLNGVKQGNLSISEYFTNLKVIWDEINVLRPSPKCNFDIGCNCRAIIKEYVDYCETKYVIRFLKGLNDDYSRVSNQVMIMTPMPNIRTVFGMAVKLERQLQYVNTKNNVSQPMVFANKLESRLSAPVPNSHNARSSRSNTGTSGKKPQSSHCGCLGHTSDTCYRIHGFPLVLSPKER